MKTITIEGLLRTGFGKSASRQIRSEGKVPAVIYGGAKEVNFSAPMAAFRSIIYTSEFMLAEVKVDGKSYNCVLKDLQFDKVTDKLIHVDFLELVPGDKVIVNIPVNYIGTPIGVREGGRLVTKIKSLRVKVLPENLQEKIDVDISKMKVGDNIRVQDVKVADMEILNSPRIPIVSVTTTRLLRQEDTKDAGVTPDEVAEDAPAGEAVTEETAGEAK